MQIIKQIIKLVAVQLPELPDVEIRGRVDVEPPRNPMPSAPHGTREMRWEVSDPEIPDALSKWTALSNIEGVVEVHCGGGVVRLTRGSGVQVVGGVVRIVGYAG